MPQLDEILKNRAKKFVKKEYRPWDLGGENHLDKAFSPSDAIPATTSHKDIASFSEFENDLSRLNKTQNEHKLNTQSIHSPHTINTQIEHNDEKIEHKLDTKPYTALSNNLKKAPQKVDTKLSFASLSGIQREIVVLFFHHCQIAKQDTTNEISVAYIASSLNIPLGSVKNSIVRLEQKNFVTRIEFKNGRGGWSRYKLSDALYSELLFLNKVHKLDTNHTLIERQLNTQLNTQVYTNPSSSSSLNKTTTEEETREFHSILPTEWENIDLTPLESIGFNTNKLKQIYHAHKLSAEMVQDSIYAYAFDREINKVQHQSPINFIMSLLKVKGMPYEFPENYESPQERAIRLYHERKRAHKEKQQQYVESLKLEAFEEWLSELPPEEQEQLIPWEARKLPSMRRSALFHHYQEKLWPAHEKNIVGKIT